MIVVDDVGGGRVAAAAVVVVVDDDVLVVVVVVASSTRVSPKQSIWKTIIVVGTIIFLIQSNGEKQIVKATGGRKPIFGSIPSHSSFRKIKLQIKYVWILLDH